MILFFVASFIFGLYLGSGKPVLGLAAVLTAALALVVTARR